MCHSSPLCMFNRKKNYMKINIYFIGWNIVWHKGDTFLMISFTYDLTNYVDFKSLKVRKRKKTNKTKTNKNGCEWNSGIKFWVQLVESNILYTEMICWFVCLVFFICFLYAKFDTVWLISVKKNLHIIYQLVKLISVKQFLNAVVLTSILSK